MRAEWLDQVRNDRREAALRLQIFGIFATLAEFERDLIRERTMAGLAAARARGRKGGRKRREEVRPDKGSGPARASRHGE